jgi:hypothetical protein
MNEAIDPQNQILRNIMLIKMIRLRRVGRNFIPSKNVARMWSTLNKPNSQDEKIAQHRMIDSTVRTLNQGFMILLVTFVLGMLWYRLSDYLLQQIGPDEDDERYWVVFYNLKHTSCMADLGEKMDVWERMIFSMYYMLTTLSTVGYGDSLPKSIMEKAVCAGT